VSFLGETSPLCVDTVTWGTVTWVYDRVYHNIVSLFVVCVYNVYQATCCRSQWPLGLKCRSTAARLLRSWVRIPPGAWMFVVCCQVEVSATSWSLVQRSPIECGASCVIKKPRERGGHSPCWAAVAEKIIIIIIKLHISAFVMSNLEACAWRWLITRDKSCSLIHILNTSNKQ
jgi:hypothetical protein